MYTGEYLWPARPENATSAGMIGLYEDTDWVGQIKKNGTNNIIIISPEGELTFMTRHNDFHKQWEPNEATRAYFASLAGHGWLCLNAELMHNKTPHIKDVNYIHDIYAFEGETLEGTTLMERQAILAEIIGEPVGETHSHYVINDNIWLVKNRTDLEQAWEDCQDFPEDEGLVLKNKKMKMAFNSKPNANKKWQMKIRKPTKNYEF